MLISLRSCESQVKGLMTANLTVDDDRNQLIDVHTQLIPSTGYPRTLDGPCVPDEVTSA